MLFLFLLPWQTRWIYQAGELNGGYWEYGTFSLYGTEILLWLIIILFALDRFGRKEFWTKILSREHYKSHRANLFVGLAVIFFLAFFVLNSLDRQISYNFVFYILGGMCLALIISQANYFAGKAAAALWLSGTAQGLLALGQFLSQDTTVANKWLGLAAHAASEPGSFVVEFAGERWLRAYGSFGSPNSLGIYLAVIFVLGLYLSRFVAEKKYKPALVAGQLIILAGLLLSFSRGAWLAAAAGVLVYIVIASGVKRSEAIPSGTEIASSASHRRFLAMTGILWPYAVLILSFILLLFPFFSARFNLNNRVEIKSINERKTQLREVREIFGYRPLAGVGPGAYTLALYQISPGRPAWQYQPVHNIYALALVEYGALGLALWAWLYVFLLRRAIKINLAFLPVIATLLAAGLFDHWLWSMYTGVIFWWLIWGIGLRGGEE